MSDSVTAAGSEALRNAVTVVASFVAKTLTLTELRDDEQRFIGPAPRLGLAATQVAKRTVGNFDRPCGSRWLKEEGHATYGHP